MRKKLLLSFGAITAVMLGVIGASAFEAHVVNVTAKIENALSVSPKTITFGTVFPQEVRHESLKVALSDSFKGEDRVDSISYRLVQKLHETEDTYTGVTEDTSDVPEATGTYYPSLCAYLSKHKIETDLGQNEVEVDAFHNDRHWATSEHVMYDKIATGYLTKSGQDTEDDWDIDLAVPCFEDECAQDWSDFVYGINPNASSTEYILPQTLKDADFMCDLWIEVTGISDNDTNTCGNDIMEGTEECDGTDVLAGRTCDSQCKLVPIDAGTCKMKIDFSLFENYLSGDVQEKVYVGGVEYAGGEWFKLDSVDTATNEDVTGLAVTREADRVKITLHGSHDDGSKEVVNAVATADGATFSSLENVDYESWDDNTYENGNAGQDEAYLDSATSSSFYTTVTTADDSYYIYYTCN